MENPILNGKKKSKYGKQDMYLINQYGLPAFSYTSQELEEELGKVEVDQGFRETMLRVFYEADHVKYAKEKITPEEFVAIASKIQNQKITE